MNEGGDGHDIHGILKALRLHNRAAERAEPLDRMVGSWAVDGRCRPYGTGPWLPVAGEAEGRWVVDGRYLQFSMATEMAGVACNSANILCYDPLAERFQDVWFDNVGVGLYRAQGAFTPSTRRLEMERQFANPVTGARETIRTVWNFENSSALDLALLRPDADGEWRPFVELMLLKTPRTPPEGLKRAMEKGDTPIPVSDVRIDWNDDVKAPAEPLARLVGKWRVEAYVDVFGTRVRAKAVGTAEGRALMGGKFVQLEAEIVGPSFPPYRAFLILAHNPVTNAFESAMFDNALVSMPMLDGTFDGETMTLREHGEHTNPVLDRRHPVRTEWRFGNDDAIDLRWEAPLARDGAWKPILRATLRREA